MRNNDSRQTVMAIRTIGVEQFTCQLAAAVVYTDLLCFNLAEI